MHLCIGQDPPTRSCPIVLFARTTPPTISRRRDAATEQHAVEARNAESATPRDRRREAPAAGGAARAQVTLLWLFLLLAAF